MPVHNEITVGRLLILADAGFDQRSFFHRGESEGDVFTNPRQCRLTDDLLPGSRIESGAPRIIGHLEAAAVVARDAVEKSLAVVAPHRKMLVGETGVSGGRAEEKNVLLGGADHVAQSFGEQFAKPRSAGKDIVISFEPRAVGERQAAKLCAFESIG